MRVGILTEFPSLYVQSGPAIHTRFLHDGLVRRGHSVVLIGPSTNGPQDDDDVERHLFKGMPYPTHPKVTVPFPWPLNKLTNGPRVDIVHGQTNSHMVHYANWQRKMHGTAVLNTNIIHLPTHSHFVLSDKLYDNKLVWKAVQRQAANAEQSFVSMYNEGDGLIVQSRFMVDYWRDRGVEVPIEAIGRPINPATFDKQPGEDPFPANFKVGKRLVVVCRHDREKRLDHLIEIFTEELAPADPEVTLTLVGDGFEHPNLKRLAAKSRFGNRIHLPGEARHERLVDWYAHADVFVYTSVSETFGNVVNEALWCGLPVVALNDRMGVAHQVLSNLNGFLVEPDRADTNRKFANHIIDLISNRPFRRQIGENAATHARRTSHPDVTLSRYEAFYDRALQRVADEITEPLAQQSKARQSAAFVSHMSRWAYYSSMFMAISKVATSLGIGREEETIVSSLEPNVTSISKTDHRDRIAAE